MNVLDNIYKVFTRTKNTYNKREEAIIQAEFTNFILCMHIHIYLILLYKNGPSCSKVTSKSNDQTIFPAKCYSYYAGGGLT